MTRRSAGSTTRSVGSALVGLALLLPLVLAAQQQQQAQPLSDGHQHGVLRPSSASPFEALKVPRPNVETAHKHAKDTVVSDDASAIAILAPASLDLEHAVRAPPAGVTGKSKTSAGLSSLLNERSLQDWEIEDFILLATVDGTIHARDRRTGVARWAIHGIDGPMVETTYHKPNRSQPGDHRLEHDFLWIVEPVRDGSLYIYRAGPDAGIQKLGVTVKQLVEDLSPFSSDDPPVAYTAEKKNMLYTIDAATGRVLNVFSALTPTKEEQSRRRVAGLESNADAECGTSGTLTLGRTEYTIGISSLLTGHLICTLKYSEWGPNVRDSDLHSQYSSTMDGKYVYIRHNGGIFAFDHAQVNDRPLYTQKLSSPVARVFDVARPTKMETPDAPLIILPQPAGPIHNNEILSSSVNPSGRVFINCTENGGWYAMSDRSYPLVTGEAPPALCHNPDWLQSVPSWKDINPAKRTEALIGVHFVDKHAESDSHFPTLPPPETQSPPAERVALGLAQAPPPLTSVMTLGNSRLLGYAAQNAVDIGITLPFVAFIVFLYINRRKLGKVVTKAFDVEKIPGVREALMSPPPTPAIPNDSFSATVTGVDIGDLDGTANNDGSDQARSEDGQESSPRTIRIEEPQRDEAATPKKKKAHRGQRGGAGRKKARKDSKDVEEEKMDKIVSDIKDIGKDPSMEPDVIKVSGKGAKDITDVSGTFKVNNLVVSDSVLGYGSHGTIVYQGSFEGREVAVKRMLLEFYDVASHEVSLLQESDDHPNVIRYFCRQQSAGFLYIALELCPASLQDVVEKPGEYPGLAQAALRDLPNVLYQIAAGVRYLHSLKIVHRDLKPQNILVAPPKIPRNTPDAILPPRLLISDFGLCKKLEGDQSSFRATTAHAAGTSGWRAPELLVDDDASPIAPATTASEGATSGDTSEPAIIDTLSNRRATRAIDIFSLGCVFFYILSRGNHPFGERYMREANIVKGHYNLDQLQELAEYGYEAAALIECMLDHNPRQRPDAQTVMTHPFFWSPEKRLNFLVDVSDHFEWEPRDPPSPDLQTLEAAAPAVIGGTPLSPPNHHHHKHQPPPDFLRRLDKAFVDTLGKQRKYVGGRMLDLLRALRNKKNHYQDMPEHVKAHVGPLPEGYLSYWSSRFPSLLLQCYYVVVKCRLEELPRFKAYFSTPS